MRVFYLGDALKAANSDNDNDDRLCAHDKTFYKEHLKTLSDPDFRHICFHLWNDVQVLKEQLLKLQLQS